MAQEAQPTIHCTTTPQLWELTGGPSLSLSPGFKSLVCRQSRGALKVTAVQQTSVLCLQYDSELKNVTSLHPAWSKGQDTDPHGRALAFLRKAGSGRPTGQDAST